MFRYVCIHLQMHAHTHNYTFLLLSTERLGNNDISITVSMPTAHILNFLKPFSNKRNQSSLEKWLVAGLGQ